MKRIRNLIPLAALALALPLFNTGCSTLTPTQDQRLADAKIVVKGAARTAAIIAINKDASGKNHQYVETAIVCLDAVLVSQDYSREGVVKALEPVFKEAKDPNVAMALMLALDTYEAFLGRLVKGQVAGNPVARELVFALKEGGKEALAAVRYNPNP